MHRSEPAFVQGGGWGPPGGAPPSPGGYGPPGGFAPAPPGKPITGSPQTMAMHAMTIDPRTGLPKGERPPASTAAVVAIVCGVLLCLGPLTGIPAIIAGIMGRRAQAANPDQVGGGTLATVGIVLGALNVLGTLAWFFIAVVAALLGGDGR